MINPRCGNEFNIAAKIPRWYTRGSVLFPTKSHFWFWMDSLSEKPICLNILVIFVYVIKGFYSLFSGMQDKVFPVDEYNQHTMDSLQRWYNVHQLLLSEMISYRVLHNICIYYSFIKLQIKR